MIYVVVIAAVVIALLGTAIYKAFAVRNRADFLVAGRKLAWPVLVFTLLSQGSGKPWQGHERRLPHSRVCEIRAGRPL